MFLSQWVLSHNERATKRTTPRPILTALAPAGIDETIEASKILKNGAQDVLFQDV